MLSTAALCNRALPSLRTLPITQASHHAFRSRLTKAPCPFQTFVAAQRSTFGHFHTTTIVPNLARPKTSGLFAPTSPLPRLTPFTRAHTQRSFLSAKPDAAVKPPSDAVPTATEQVVDVAAKQKTIKATLSDARRLLRLAKPEAVPIAAAIALLVVSSAITMSVPFSMGKIIDIVTTPTTTTFMGLTLPQFFTVLSVVFVTGALANTGRVVIFRLTGERIIQRLRNDLYKAILKQDMAFFDANRSGDLISRLTNDTNVVGKSLTMNISDGLSAKLTAIMMAIVPPVAFFAVFYGRYVRELSRKTQTSLGEITKVAEERLSNIRTVQAFAKEDVELDRYAIRVKDVFSLAKKEAYASGLFFGTAGLSGNLIILAVLGYGGQMVTEGIITVGELASFLLYTAYVGGSLAGLTSFYSEVMKGIGAGSRLFELLDRTTAIPTDAGVVLRNAYGNITFRDVTFVYPSRSQFKIFDNLSLTVEPGTIVAICGQSGSGKSTIGSLLLRFYDPSHGSIFINGTDIRDLNLRWWREQIGLVSQVQIHNIRFLIRFILHEPVLFAGTIAENISYGRNGATMDEIREAAIKANCQGFIDAFPDKYETFVGERGISLSGGQKQRIAIARALLKNPSILILDEATSALDSESEALVQDALERLMVGRTVFTIAHRISTIRTANIIACIENGRVAEIGPYDELIRRENGVFKRLVEHQLLGGDVVPVHEVREKVELV
ncbi:P-loop containing nucleoside triphosphate hydrolase protein [Endogone sp. FLAS-F59071]|nr:P-loop containing nucleoside triphosphate hydrolase protein [Endogone sp. FLAS-F59071]|eukprot:RUS20628.1 P-loop containing nucleoside triphosphate hydrolase protein [Endogone sp. FLAS-F59071]